MIEMMCGGRQEALASAVSEKDAHLAWLEVTGDGEHNFHTRESCDRLRRERRQLLGRMKEEVSIWKKKSRFIWRKESYEE